MGQVGVKVPGCTTTVVGSGDGSVVVAAALLPLL